MVWLSAEFLSLCSRFGLVYLWFGGLLSSLYFVGSSSSSIFLVVFFPVFTSCFVVGSVGGASILFSLWLLVFLMLWCSPWILGVFCSSVSVVFVSISIGLCGWLLDR